MRKLASVALVAVALLLVAAAPSDADGRRGGHRPFFRHGGVHTRVFIGAGPVWWGPSWYYPYYYPYYYPPPYYVYSPPPVIVQEPPVYVQQQPAAPAPPVQEPQGYWYYCQSAKGYYPTVPSCPEAWLKVAPRSQ